MNKTIPFNDTARIYIAHQEKLLAHIIDVAKSGWWILGKNTQNFCLEFAKFCGTEYCLSVANGTDALELALRAVLTEITPNGEQEVITVANAGGYSTTACRLVGAVPVYADIETDSQLLCVKSLINCLGPNVKAIIVTHLYGGVVDIIKVRSILDENGYKHVKIIEDCAQAHGAILANCRVGSLGDVATFSFYPTKNIGAMGDAGAITTSDKGIYQRIMALHQYGWRGKYKIEVAYGRNSRMDEMQAAILGCLLPELDEFNSRRKTLYNLYREASGNKLYFLDHGEHDYVAHLAVVLSPERDAFVKFMKSKGIATDIHYPILDCDQSAWKAMPMRIDEQSQLRISKLSRNQVVSLPCFPTLREDEVEYICQALNQWSSI